MSDSLSGFKMFDRAPYTIPDSRVFTEIFIDGIKGEEKIYGPFFTATIINYALRAVAKMTGEAQPEDIKTPDQLKEYLLSKSDKLSVPPHFLVLWAQFVTDKKFEGSLAVGTQLMYKGFVRKAVELEGDPDMLRNADIDQIMAKLRQLAVRMQVAPLEFGYKKNADGSIDVFHGGCHVYEGCQMSVAQDLLKRPDGRMSCGVTVIVCHLLKMGTNHEWDYIISKFSKTHCLAKCFMI